MNKNSKILVVGHNDIIEKSLITYFKNNGYDQALSSSEQGLNVLSQNAVDKFFIEKYPESPRTNQAMFEMGNYLFNQKKYQRANRWYQKMKTKKLNKEERYQYSFNTAYCYFDDKKYDQAESLFYEIQGQPGPKKADASYYYAYLLKMQDFKIKQFAVIFEY